MSEAEEKLSKIHSRLGEQLSAGENKKKKQTTKHQANKLIALQIRWKVYEWKGKLWYTGILYCPSSVDKMT